MPILHTRAGRWTYRLVILALVVFIFIRGFFTAVKTVVQQRVVIEQRTDSIQHYKDLAGREHSARKQAVADKATLKSWYGPLVDSLTRAVGIRDEQLLAFAAYGTNNSGKVPLTVTKEVRPAGDTARKFRYSDRWLDLDGILTDDDRSEMTYSIRDSLAFTTYWKRRWLLGKKTTYIDVYSLNPNVKITGLQGAQVARDRAGRFGIGPHAGYGFFFDGKDLKRGWQIGISLNYDLIQF